MVVAQSAEICARFASVAQYSSCQRKPYPATTVEKLYLLMQRDAFRQPLPSSMPMPVPINQMAPGSGTTVGFQVAPSFSAMTSRPPGSLNPSLGSRVK